MACRICLEEGGKAYCKCSGTSGLVHEECLLKWINMDGRHQCEICKHTFEFEEKTLFRPSCQPSIEDLAVSQSVGANIVVLISSTIMACGFTFIFVWTREFLVGTVCWTTINAIGALALHDKGYPLNVYIVYNTVSTLTTAFIATGMPYNRQARVSTAIQVFILMTSIVCWLAVCSYRNCFVQNMRNIKVYQPEQPQANVDTRVHTDQPQQEECSRIII